MVYTTNQDDIKSDVSSRSAAVHNFLKPNGFRLVIKDLPKVSYTCQAVSLPGIQLGFINQPTPFIDRPIIGDKLTYTDLTIKFIIAEDLSNYLELYDWVTALGFPNDYTEFKAFAASRLNRFPFVGGATNNEVLGYSDGTLTILDSNNNAKTNIILKDLFPVAVDPLNFDTTVSGGSLEYLTSSATFKFRSIKIDPV